MIGRFGVLGSIDNQQAVSCHGLEPHVRMVKVGAGISNFGTDLVIEELIWRNWPLRHHCRAVGEWSCPLAEAVPVLRQSCLSATVEGLQNSSFTYHREIFVRDMIVHPDPCGLSFLEMYHRAWRCAIENHRVSRLTVESDILGCPNEHVFRLP